MCSSTTCGSPGSGGEATPRRQRRDARGSRAQTETRRWLMKAVVVAPGEGRHIALASGGAGVTVKVSEAETGGLCTVWEGRVPAGAVGAAPHFHHGRDEFFYILEGELVLRIGDEQHAAPAGTFAFIPRETVHGFHNPSPAPA